ncbi:MAG: type III polyketide synthase [Methyloligellaceae bacterium]
MAQGDAEIASIACAVPPYKFSQTEALSHAEELFPHLNHLSSVFLNTGISTRHSCMPLEWYRDSHGWTDRAAVYQENALNLIEEAALKAIADAGIGIDDIDALVLVSSTGVAVPSLDALLANKIGLRPDVERLPIFGLGCAGGVTGLARASRIAQTLPDGHVLLLAVELCALNFRLADSTKAMFVSSALFGDGAAGIVVRSASGFGETQATARRRITAFGEHMWPDTEYIMGWSVEEDGLGVVISPEIPSFARRKMLAPIETFLESQGLTLGDLDGVVLHPGGRRVLESFSAASDIGKDELKHAWSVLRDYGNMSSPTVLFVLERTLQSGATGRHLMIALGPGFTVSFALLEL